MAANARRNGGGTQNPPGENPAAAKAAELRAKCARVVHHEACACRGYLAGSNAVPHDPRCECGQLAADLGIVASRCW